MTITPRPMFEDAILAAHDAADPLEAEGYIYERDRRFARKLTIINQDGTRFAVHADTNPRYCGCQMFFNEGICEHIIIAADVLAQEDEMDRKSAEIADWEAYGKYDTDDLDI